MRRGKIKGWHDAAMVAGCCADPRRLRRERQRAATARHGAGVLHRARHDPGDGERLRAGARGGAGRPVRRGGGGGTFGGIGLGFPLIGGGAPAYPATALSTALIRVPAEPPYAQVWRQSQIRIQFGDPPGVKYISIPAPPPPPPA